MYMYIIYVNLFLIIVCVSVAICTGEHLVQALAFCVTLHFEKSVIMK